MTRVCTKCKCERELADFVIVRDKNRAYRKKVCVYCQPPVVVDDYVVKKKDDGVNDSITFQTVWDRVKQLEKDLDIHPFPKFKNKIKYLKEVI
jgi:hypothetical protein